MTTTASGVLYIASTDQIFKIDTDGSTLLTIGSLGCGDGQLTEVHGLTSDAGGNIYAADYGCNQIAKFDENGNFLLRFAAGFVMGVAVDTGGNIYTTGQNHNAINKYDAAGTFLEALNPTGEPVSTWPYGLTSDASGNLYIADCGSFRIKKMDGDGNLLLAFGSEGTGDGQFSYPCGVAVDALGNIYVSDVGGTNTRVQKFDSAGAFLMKFGSVGTGRGQFGWSPGITVDLSGNIYVADRPHHRVEKFDASGTFVSQWASTQNVYITDGETVIVPATTSRFADTVYVESGGTLSLEANASLSLTALLKDVGGTILHGSGASLSVSAGWASTKTLFSEVGPWGVGMATGPDGFPRIAYVNYNEATLNYIRCTDEDCAVVVEAEVTNDASQDNSGASEILTLGADGFARIIYLDTDGKLNLVRCLDQDCATKNIIPVDTNTNNDPGYYGMSTVMGDDDLPRVAYANCGDNYDVHFVRFTDADTPGVNTTISDVGVIIECNPYAEASSMAIGADGFVRLVFQDGNDEELKLARCTDADCTAPVVTTVEPDASASPGYNGSVIRTGSDDFPRIAHVDDNFDLWYITCTDTDCTSPTITELVATDGNSYNNNFGMDLRSGDLASISYEDTSGYLHILNCTNATCSTSTEINLGLASGIEGGAPVVIGSDDLPHIAYSDYDTGLYYARFQAGAVFHDSVTPDPDPEPEPVQTSHTSGSSSLSPAQVARIIAPKEPDPRVCLPGHLFNILTGAPCPATAPTPTTDVGAPTPGVGAAPATAPVLFTTYLTLGITDPQVLALQKYLNSHGYPVALSGVGSAGNETSFFGSFTKAAVIKYQKANNIAPAIGNVGPLTRASLNAGK
jgi:hypothetical protein